MGRERLSNHYDSSVIDLRTHASWWTGLLLEEGDSDDLTQLAHEVGEATLRSWFRERGARQLSRRSQAFWSLLLTPATEPPPSESPLTEPIPAAGTPDERLWLP